MPRGFPRDIHILLLDFLQLIPYTVTTMKTIVVTVKIVATVPDNTDIQEVDLNNKLTDFQITSFGHTLKGATVKDFYVANVNEIGSFGDFTPENS